MEKNEIEICQCILEGRKFRYTIQKLNNLIILRKYLYVPDFVEFMLKEIFEYPKEFIDKLVGMIPMVI